jgi:hypothetical protein
MPRAVKFEKYGVMRESPARGCATDITPIKALPGSTIA